MRIKLRLAAPAVALLLVACGRGDGRSTDGPRTPDPTRDVERQTIDVVVDKADWRRIERISGNQLALNQGTLYPALLKLEQAGWINAAWRESDGRRRVKVYGLTKAGRRQIRIGEADWQRSQGIVARFLNIQDDMA